MTDIVRIGDQLVDLGNGNIGDGTLRVCVASDDANLSLLSSIASSLSSIASSLSSIDAAIASVETILNDVYEPSNHALKTSAL